jgi:hypothetical protein
VVEILLLLLLFIPLLLLLPILPHNKDLAPLVAVPTGSMQIPTVVDLATVTPTAKADILASRI